MGCQQFSWARLVQQQPSCSSLRPGPRRIEHPEVTGHKHFKGPHMKNSSLPPTLLRPLGEHFDEENGEECNKDWNAEGLCVSSQGRGLCLLFVLLTIVEALLACPMHCSCKKYEADCSNRGLVTIPTDIPSNIKSLSLSNNKLSTLPALTFTNFTTLEKLDLSSNYLDQLPSNVFDYISSLTDLNLRNNSIRSLDKNIFYKTTNLQRLDLSANGLSQIPLLLFDEMQNLTWLNLEENRMQNLEREAFESLELLQQLQLGGNPWECDCSLRDFKHWMEWFLYKGGKLDGIECFLPKDLRGKDLRVVPVEMFNYCIQLEDAKRSAVNGKVGTGPPCVKHELSTSRPQYFPTSECIRQRYRPVSVRRAIGTVVVAGVVCGIVCIMMVVAGTYGCIYASLMAKYHRELKKRQPLMGEGEQEQEEQKQASSMA
ncbi:leucine-rich repeat and transmembrane domain-containing protein 2 [Heptranchias perlo]|uniref:leucine-rich repeat and transmembrane domain-containing protein 2 n=1 Tax=Heptranchias perlo TaxID=212740 RepID=UPI00355A219E